MLPLILPPQMMLESIGSGSAGSVVANRLSENPDFKVLLLEAGGKATETTEIPLFASLAFRSKLDWNYTLAPSSQYCLGMIDKILILI
ncbi:hypothetical protein Anas_07305 [Armadillidium nasatum]|uniref:Uncharacterized protein n=1 Tax=Armadillidium nasatum TaxID=96803 RepID=A0A5N5SSX0_9CRUS|nr:hypothetical protein Anas_07305 [Armadillidium nasatum]